MQAVGRPSRADRNGGELTRVADDRRVALFFLLPSPTLFHKVNDTQPALCEFSVQFVAEPT